jgi:chorismate mutase/prephenate dehydratase
MSSDDPVLHDLREQITALDSSLIAAVNRRLELVTQLKRHKDEHGIDFVDPERERWMFDHQSAANTGPLSDEGLRAFYTELLALTKREV